MYHEIIMWMQEPLAVALRKCYSAQFLKWLYNNGLSDIAGTLGDITPQTHRVSSGATFPMKERIAGLLLKVLRDKTLGRQLFNALPQPTRAAITATTWEKNTNLAALEKAIGHNVVIQNPNDRVICYEPFMMLPEHGFLVLVPDIKNHSYYLPDGRKQRKEDFFVMMPDAVRRAFQALITPPPDFELLPVPDIPASAGYHYSCASTAITDMRLVAKYIAQGHLKYTKSEKIAATSAKTIHQLTAGPEFFENSNNPDMALLRTRLLTGGMAFVSAEARECLLSAPDNAEPIRAVFENIFSNAMFMREELLQHLDNRWNKECTVVPRNARTLTSFFGKLPSGAWVAWDNICRYHTLRDTSPNIFLEPAASLRCKALDTRGGQNWHTRPCEVFLDQPWEFDLMGAPLLKGCAFLLAAFGMAEIIYTAPTNTINCHPGKKYLTPFDGLRFVRLTPLGEFVFGRKNTCETPDAPPPRAAIDLDTTRLIATCHGADALTELALGQLMEKLTPSRHRMTPNSLLGGCTSRKDIEKRIQLFRDVVAMAPPPIWEEFFKKTLTRIAPLAPEPDYVVLKINDDEEIRHMLTSDATLRKIILKVEGLRIAVRRSDLKQLSKRLEQFGYLSPLATLVAGPDSSDSKNMQNH